MLLFAEVKPEPLFHQILLQDANLFLHSVTHHRVEFALFGMHVVNHTGSSNFEFVLAKQITKVKRLNMSCPFYKKKKAECLERRKDNMEHKPNGNCNWKIE